MMASAFPGTVGFPLPGVEARIRDEVLEIRGPNLFKGYWRNPEKTAEEMRPDGYFITGDMATMAADGRVAIVGRAKDLIIAGGLNIYPKEIELAIDALPGVGESAVIGVPHPDLGEGVVAVVVRTDPALDEAAVLAGIADLARFKQPRRIVFADSPAAQRDGQGAEGGAAGDVRGSVRASPRHPRPSSSAPAMSGRARRHCRHKACPRRVAARTRITSRLPPRRHPQAQPMLVEPSCARSRGCRASARCRSLPRFGRSGRR